MIWLVVFAVGLVVGLLVGRRWALLAAVAFGVYVAAASEVDEVSPAFLGLIYVIVGAAGITAGVALRRRRAR